jgi:hypothetical protein
MPLDPPPPPPPSSLPPPPPAYAASEPPAPYGIGIPTYPAPAEPRRTRSRGARIGLAAGVVALVGVVASLTVALSGSGAGAGSPEEAVEQFAAAVSDEDIVGAITMMPPSEVGSAHELYDPLIQLLVKNGELSAAGEPLAGVDIEITDLELENVDLAEGIGKVYLRGGTVTVDVTASDVDPVLRENGMVEDTHEEFDIADAQQAIDEANSELGSFAEGFGAMATGSISGPFLMTVEEGGRWYVSPTYSLAEYAREALGLPEPEFGSWRDQVAPGAGSPGAVVDSFAAAMSSVDSAALIESLESGEPMTNLEVKGALAPGEFAALFDYAPAFESWAEDMMGMGFSGAADAMTQELADMLRDVEFDVTVAVDTSERAIADDRVKVVFDRATLELHVQGVIEDEPVKVDMVAELFDGLCYEISADALVDGVSESFQESGCGDQAFPGTDFDGVFLVTVQRDGGWYFSPTETLVEYARVAIESELAK